MTCGLLCGSDSFLSRENMNASLLIRKSARSLSKGCNVYLAVRYDTELTTIRYCINDVCISDTQKVFGLINMARSFRKTRFRTKKW